MLMIQIYLYLKETWNLLLKLQMNICLNSDLFIANKLSLNTDKTCFMAFSTPKNMMNLK